MLVKYKQSNLALKFQGNFGFRALSSKSRYFLSVFGLILYSYYLCPGNAPKIRLPALILALKVPSLYL